MPRARPDRVRFIALIYRKEGMSVEDFQAYWRDEHTKVFSSIAIVKKNIFNYEQSHANVEALENLKKSGFPTFQADGIAIFEAANFEKLREVFEDDEFKKVVVPDEERFLDRTRFTVLPCDIVPVFDDPA